MARGNQAQREQAYREHALKIFPWICAHCGREFDGKKLSQLTVHQPSTFTPFAHLADLLKRKT